jgi:hypothetical protein
MKGHTKLQYELIKLEMLNAVPDNSTVENSDLLELGVQTKANKGRKLYKVVGNGELLRHNLTVKAHAFTNSSKKAIEEKGGTCLLMSPTRKGIPLAIALAEKKIIRQNNLIKLKQLREKKANSSQANKF